MQNAGSGDWQPSWNYIRRQEILNLKHGFVLRKPEYCSGVLGVCWPPVEDGDKLAFFFGKSEKGRENWRKKGGIKPGKKEKKRRKKTGVGKLGGIRGGSRGLVGWLAVGVRKINK